MAFGDFFERANGLVKLTALGLHHTFHEQPLHMGRRFCFFLPDQLLGELKLTGLNRQFDGRFGFGIGLGVGLSQDAR